MSEQETIVCIASTRMGDFPTIRPVDTVTRQTPRGRKYIFRGVMGNCRYGSTLWLSTAVAGHLPFERVYSPPTSFIPYHSTPVNAL
jgi:hypothetical protein